MKPRVRWAFAGSAAIVLGLLTPAGSFAAAVPSAPRLGTFYTSMTSTTVDLGSPADDGGSPITGYVVEYTLDNYQTFQRLDLAADATQFVISGLQNKRTYRMRVAASNANGLSSWTNSVVRGLYPPSKPRIESVLVRHDALEVRAFSSLYTSMTISAGSRHCTLKSYQSLCDISGLTGGKSYSVTAVATNPAGPSVASDPVTATPVGAATKVRSLKAKVVVVKGVRRIVLTWKAPSNLRQGVLKGVTLYDGVHPGKGVQSRHPWSTKLVVDKVSRHHTYTFRVGAITRPKGDDTDIHGASSTIKVKVK
ncbi:fibronectin type III domain-containing protein [Kineosporia sp. J2-2]|uniref:Fibronectin type III domain-containing protein n=1 Tax=Kineosporia corallincola TaxID=2835133 RepID=A0ABS5TBK8_9ACTN|nr:fibronectin type III domain-containing protein [Kineosporia corallincola]MBT0767591.1 fibronectin type III domain-containing protein [Kineosporia corallincola]